MKIIGKVLWFSVRDERGVIVDSHQNEIYFDLSRVKIANKRNIKPGLLVTLTLDLKIKHIRCAASVEIPAKSERTAIERRFQKQLIDLAA